MSETENDRLHEIKDEIPKQPTGPYTRDPESGENPEAQGDEAKKHREQMPKQEKAKGDADAEE
jgi:hypothetical protein